MFFAYGYSVAPRLFIENIIFSPLNCFSISVKMSTDGIYMELFLDSSLCSLDLCVLSFGQCYMILVTVVLCLDKVVGSTLLFITVISIMLNSLSLVFQNNLVFSYKISAWNSISPVNKFTVNWHLCYIEFSNHDHGMILYIICVLFDLCLKISCFWTTVNGIIFSVFVFMHLLLVYGILLTFYVLALYPVNLAELTY